MLWKHLRAVLIGPVLVTIGVPALLAGTVGTATLSLPQPLDRILIALGVVIVAGGLAMEVWTIGLFDRIGKGTLSPLDPTNVLVVHGPYRHVRNPMFSAVLAILIGEAIAARSPVLLAWFGLFFLLIGTLVPLVEEPHLVSRFGDEYIRYRRHVPRWLPRLRPWSP